MPDVLLPARPTWRSRSACLELPASRMRANKDPTVPHFAHYDAGSRSSLTASASKVTDKWSLGACDLMGEAELRVFASAQRTT